VYENKQIAIKIENLDFCKHKQVAIKIEEPSGPGKSAKEKAASNPRLGIARSTDRQTGCARYFFSPIPQRMGKVCEHSPPNTNNEAHDQVGDSNNKVFEVPLEGGKVLKSLTIRVASGDDQWMDEQVEPLFKMLGPKLKTHLAKGGSTSDLSWSTLRQWLPERGFSSTAKKPNTLRLLYKRCVEYEKHEHDKVVMPALLLPSASCHAAQTVACPAWMKKPGVS